MKSNEEIYLSLDKISVCFFNDIIYQCLSISIGEEFNLEFGNIRSSKRLTLNTLFKKSIKNIDFISFNIIDKKKANTGFCSIISTYIKNNSNYYRTFDNRKTLITNIEGLYYYLCDFLEAINNRQPNLLLPAKLKEVMDFIKENNDEDNSQIK